LDGYLIACQYCSGTSIKKPDTFKYEKAHIYTVCMYFYTINDTSNFSTFPCAKYDKTRQARARITEVLGSSFMLILHTTLLIMTLLSRARGFVLTTEIFLIRTCYRLKPTLPPLAEMVFQLNLKGRFSQF